MKPYKILIDNKPFDHPSQFITGKEIKTYVNALQILSWLKVNMCMTNNEIGHNDSSHIRISSRTFYTGPKTPYCTGLTMFLPEFDREYLPKRNTNIKKK